MSDTKIATDETGPRLKSALPKTFLVAATVGGMIGLGILRSPGEIAAVVSDPHVYLALWLFGGLFVLLSSAVVAELVGMTPRSGGTYPLVRRAFGPFAGFVIGWVDWLSFAANIALKAVVIIEFVAILAPAAMQWQTALAIIVTSVFAALQLRGVALGAVVQQVSTVAIGLLVLGFSLALFFAEPASAGDAVLTPAMKTGFGAWGLVAAAIIFSYDGWLYPSYFSGEARSDGGTPARSCVTGTAIVVALYFLLNAAMIANAPLSVMAGNDLALARLLELAFSPTAANTVVLAALLFLLSHQNLLYMGGSRIIQALAVDGFAAKRAKTIGRHGNPVFAVFITWLVSVGLMLIGGFEFLLYLCVFFFIVLYLALILGVLILRRREPDKARPYRAWGHPYSSVVVLLGWALISVFEAVAERETALYALAMIAVAWPVYRYASQSRSQGGVPENFSTR